MVHKATTADAEERRLRRLSEAKHDRCEECPPVPRQPPEASIAQRRRRFGAALFRAVSSRAPKGSIALTTHQYGAGRVRAAFGHDLR
jgi:hypothetical protein